MRFILLSTLGSLFFTVASPAAVIYSGPQNVSLPFSMGGVYVNVFTNSTSLSTPGDYDTAPWMFFSFGGAGIATSPLVRTVVTGSVFAGMEQTVNLAYGSSVGPSSRFSIGDSGYNGSETHVGAAINRFQLGTQGYIGYEFEPTVGGPSYFAVARITIANDGVNATLHDWSYESTVGTAIAVPEPSKTLLILTFACLLLQRRQRKHRSHLHGGVD
jgi:hypothetical protein